MKHFEFDGLSDAVRMNVQASQLTRWLNNLKGRLEVIMNQQRCDLVQAVAVFKERHKTAGKQLSEETLMDLELLLEEHTRKAV